MEYGFTNCLITFYRILLKFQSIEIMYYDFLLTTVAVSEVRTIVRYYDSRNVLQK